MSISYEETLKRNRERSKKDRKLNPEKYHAYDRKRKAKNPEHIRATNKKSNHKKRLEKFGLTSEQHLALLNKQNHLCAICKGPQPDGRDLAIDHCHVTLKVRGLLCNPCNTVLGLMKENQEALYTAIEYLKEHS